MGIAARRLQRSASAKSPASFPLITAGAGAVGSARYPIPSSKVLYVSPTGSDANDGLTVGSPLKTIKHAIMNKLPGDGWTIVVRTGVYHEEIEVPDSRAVFTIQNYPGETVWFDGSSVFSAKWTNNGNGTWSAPYTLAFDRALGKGTLPNIYKGQPQRVVVDQIWLDSLKLSPAADNTVPGAGQFSVNQSTQQITIGTNPSGKAVRVSDLRVALFRSNNRAQYIRGIGFRRYSPDWLEWRSAILRIGIGSIVEQITVQDSGLDLLNLGGENITIRNCTFQDSGHSGVLGDVATGTIIEKNIIRRCNRNGWESEPTTAGVKVTRSIGGITVRHNYITDICDATGIWLDGSVNRSNIINNTIVGTSSRGNNATGYRMKNGIELELSDGGFYDGVQHYSIVAGNRVNDVRFGALLIFDSSCIKAWNNDLSGAVACHIWQDERFNPGNEPPALVGTPEQSPWMTRDISVINNKLTQEPPYNLQLIAYHNVDAPILIGGAEVITRLAGTWFQPRPPGSLVQLGPEGPDAARTSFNTLEALAAVPSSFGGPMDLGENYIGASAPVNSIADLIPDDVAAAYEVPPGTQAVGPILPELVLAS